MSEYSVAIRARATASFAHIANRPFCGPGRLVTEEDLIVPIPGTTNGLTVVPRLLAPVVGDRVQLLIHRGFRDLLAEGTITVRNHLVHVTPGGKVTVRSEAEVLETARRLRKEQIRAGTSHPQRGPDDTLKPVRRLLAWFNQTRPTNDTKQTQLQKLVRVLGLLGREAAADFAATKDIPPALADLAEALVDEGYGDLVRAGKITEEHLTRRLPSGEVMYRTTDEVLETAEEIRAASQQQRQLKFV